MKQIFTLLACLFVINGFSAIVYKNINYTLNIDGNLNYNLDVNSDGTKDYVMQLTYDNQSGNMLCSIIGQTVGSNTNVADDTPENPGDPVGSQASWSSNLVLFASSGITYDGGLFTGGEHYVGLSFTLNNNNYKAWLRIVVSNYNTCLIKDLAFDNVSGNTINVGAGIPTGISTLLADNVSIRWLNSNLIVSANGSDIKDAHLVIHDLLGKELYSGSLTSSTETIPFNKPATAFYLVSLYLNNGQTITRKLLLQ